MKTYDDYKSARDVEAFILTAISEHLNSRLYKTAIAAEAYDHQQNVTILRYQKLLYTLEGLAKPDTFSPSFKLCSNFFHRIVTQQVQYELGNGMTLDKPEEKKKLGADIDNRLQDLAYAALVQGVAFGYWDLDRLRVFKPTGFVPLVDESTGALRAGIRFWQLDDDKPMRITIYDEDGVTEYRKPKNGALERINERQSYRITTETSDADGEVTINEEGYSRLPIIPLYGSKLKQSKLVGMRESIDCYDLIKSDFANDLSEAAVIYWSMKNSDYMSDIELAQFLDRLRKTKVANAEVEAHTVDVPYQARETYLRELRRDIYQDAQVLDMESLSGAQKTTVEIMAAYQPMDNMVDDFEYQILDFLHALFELTGVEAVPSFQRSRISDQTEETQMVMMAAQYLDDETILRHLPWLTPEEVERALERKYETEAARFGAAPAFGSQAEDVPEE